MNLKTNHSKAVGGQKSMCCFSQLFDLVVAKERKGFLNYGLYSVLWCRLPYTHSLVFKRQMHYNG